MKIDVFNHFTPQPVYERFKALTPDNPGLKAFGALPALWNIDARLKLMERFDDYQQILSLANPPIELLAGPDRSPELAAVANDALAEVCAKYPHLFPAFTASVPMNNAKYPHLFPAFTASVPMNNPDAAIREAARAITALGARGIQVFTNVNGQPLSSPEFHPLFEFMAGQELPVWIHPMRGSEFSDYAAEDHSENEIWFTFGWPYETSACVTRLIFSGLFDKLPDIKIITHHMGGMIPYFAEKIGLGFDQIFQGAPDRNPLVERAALRKPLLDYYHMLYADTALNGSAAATRCGHAFFGTGHSLFASDAPFDSIGGRQLIQGTLDAVTSLDLPPDEQNRIFAANTRQLLRLDDR